MSTSPPTKKARTEDFEMLPAEDAPVNNLFVEATASASTSTPKPAAPKGKKKNRRIKRTLPELYSPADVTFRDVRDFLGAEYVDAVLAKGDESEWNPPALELWSVVELKVGAFTVSGTSVIPQNPGEKLISGESLSLYEEGDKKWAIMTPFAHPGDKIKAKIFKHDRFFSSADLVEILDYSEEYRGGGGDRRVNPEGGCKYFGEWYVTLPHFYFFQYSLAVRCEMISVCGARQEGYCVVHATRDIEEWNKRMRSQMVQEDEVGRIARKEKTNHRPRNDRDQANDQWRMSTPTPPIRPPTPAQEKNRFTSLHPILILKRIINSRNSTNDRIPKTMGIQNENYSSF